MKWTLAHSTPPSRREAPPKYELQHAPAVGHRHMRRLGTLGLRQARCGKRRASELGVIYYRELGRISTSGSWQEILTYQPQLPLSPLLSSHKTQPFIFTLAFPFLWVVLEGKVEGRGTIILRSHLPPGFEYDMEAGEIF